MNDNCASITIEEPDDIDDYPGLKKAIRQANRALKQRNDEFLRLVQQAQENGAILARQAAQMQADAARFNQAVAKLKHAIAEHQRRINLRPDLYTNPPAGSRPTFWERGEQLMEGDSDTNQGFADLLQECLAQRHLMEHPTAKASLGVPEAKYPPFAN